MQVVPNFEEKLLDLIKPIKPFNTIVTFLIVTSNASAIKKCLNELNKGNYTLDEPFLLDIYRRATSDIRLRLANSLVMARLSPITFTRFFKYAYRSGKPRGKLARGLAVTLQAFLLGHPERAEKFRSFLISMIRSSTLDLKTIGLLTSGMLTTLGKPELAIFMASLRGNKLLHCNALGGIYCLAKNYNEANNVTKSFLDSSDLINEIKNIKKNVRTDPFVRRNADLALKELHMHRP